MWLIRASRRGSVAGGLVICVLVAASVPAAVAGPSPGAPAAVELRSLSGWYVSGTAPSEYQVHLDETAGRHHSACAVLETRVPKVTGFVTLAQQAPIAAFRGRRLRLTAWLRAQAVEGWTGFWMRIDSAAGKVVAFDNMQDRPVRGSTDWTSRSVVLDVPREGSVLSFGIILKGPGRVWADDFAFSEVGPEVPSTDFFAGRWKQEPRR
jgi:hypothetical protein